MARRVTSSGMPRPSPRPRGSEEGESPREGVVEDAVEDAVEEIVEDTMADVEIMDAGVEAKEGRGAGDIMVSAEGGDISIGTEGGIEDEKEAFASSVLGRPEIIG